MSTLLAQFASTTEGNSHIITFDQPSIPGKTIVAVISSSAEISALPAGWVQSQLDFDATDFSVFVLPAASHTVPITGLTFNVSVLRHAVAVIWEDVVTGSALKYAGAVSGSASGSDLGTGLHPVTADKAFALFALTSATAAGAQIGVTLSSQDQGFTSFADSGSNTVGSFEVGRLYVGQGGPVDWTSNGVTATFSGTLVGVPSTLSTIIAYDSVVDTTPPGPVTGLTATPADNSVVLNWTNPGEDESQIIVRGAQGLTAPATTTDGYSVSTALTTTATDTGLAPATNYSYSVWAVDASSNVSTRVTVTTLTTGAADTTGVMRIYHNGAWVPIGGGGAGAVTSVNTQTGDVVLNAADVGADSAGTATSAVTTHEAGTGVHTIAGTTGLQAALDAKEPASWDGTAAQYTALGTYDANTTYYVVG